MSSHANILQGPQSNKLHTASQCRTHACCRSNADNAMESAGNEYGPRSNGVAHYLSCSTERSSRQSVDVELYYILLKIIMMAWRLALKRAGCPVPR